jgi:amino acid permease
MVIFTYPLQCHPCRASLNHVFHWFHERASNGTAVDTRPLLAEEEEDDLSFYAVPLGTTRFIVLTSVILVLSYWLATTVDSLELMLAFVGSTGSTSISFILPGIFGYSLIGNDKLYGKTPLKHVRLLKYGSLALCGWGLLVVIVCLGTNIWLLGSR